jgi:hypothetical protein
VRQQIRVEVRRFAIKQIGGADAQPRAPPALLADSVAFQSPRRAGLSPVTPLCQLARSWRVQPAIQQTTDG